MDSAALQTIHLNEPDKRRGCPLMEALAVKASTREWSDRPLSLQDLSDLLWAANGLNRPEEGRYTASSAQNAHDVDLYVFTGDGVYLYDALAHALEPVRAGDHRDELMMTPPSRPDAPPRPPCCAPVRLVLVSDVSRFRFGPPELKPEWGAIDAGIVSQNISLVCAACGLQTRPRASMDKDKIKALLDLSDTQYVFLEHPVGY